MDGSLARRHEGKAAYISHTVFMATLSPKYAGLQGILVYLGEGFKGRQRIPLFLTLSRITTFPRFGA